jgi:hypothetical protein
MRKPLSKEGVMLCGRSWDDWIAQYATSHQHPVGLLGVLSAKQMGAERIIAISRHEPRRFTGRIAPDFAVKLVRS